MLSEELPIFKAAYDTLEHLVDVSRQMPKGLRYTLGERLVNLCLDMLSQVYRANMDRSHRAQSLTELLMDQRQVLLLLRVCYRQKALSTGRYAELVKLLDLVGRQATGWKNREERP